MFSFGLWKPGSSLDTDADRFRNHGTRGMIYEADCFLDDLLFSSPHDEKSVKWINKKKVEVEDVDDPGPQTESDLEDFNRNSHCRWHSVPGSPIL